MKIGGEQIEISTDFLILPRPLKDIVFKARAVMEKDYEQFEILCPRPLAPLVTPREGTPYRDVTDGDYNKTLNDYANKKHAFMYVKSLEDSKIEWSKVKMGDSNTWELFEDELREVITPIELIKVIRMIQGVNGLDDKKIEEAKKRFFATLAAASMKETSQQVGQGNTQSGAPASA